MIPATLVVEGEIVNFHSDLQRPFLWREGEENGGQKNKEKERKKTFN